MNSEYPTPEQRNNCLRLADELSSLSQNAYSKLYRNDPRYYLTEGSTEFTHSLMEHWYNDLDGLHFELFLQKTFFTAENFCYTESRDALVWRLLLITNAPLPPKPFLTRCREWADDKFSFLLQADP